MNKKIDLLRCIVGSKAHHLDNKNSDFDYRGVFIVPTIELLKIGGEVIKHTSWIEDKEDDTSFEIGRFLFMSIKCNPTCLEFFLAPIDEEWGKKQDKKILKLGEELRSLFPYIWNSNDTKNAVYADWYVDGKGELIYQKTGDVLGIVYAKDGESGGSSGDDHGGGGGSGGNHGGGGGGGGGNNGGGGGNTSGSGSSSGGGGGSSGSGGSGGGGGNQGGSKSPDGFSNANSANSSSSNVNNNSLVIKISVPRNMRQPIYELFIMLGNYFRLEHSM